MVKDNTRLYLCTTSLSQKHTQKPETPWDTHSQHLDPFSGTCVHNEPGYPQSSRVDLGARSGFVTNGGSMSAKVPKL